MGDELPIAIWRSQDFGNGYRIRSMGDTWLIIIYTLVIGSPSPSRRAIAIRGIDHHGLAGKRHPRATRPLAYSEKQTKMAALG